MLTEDAPTAKATGSGDPPTPWDSQWSVTQRGPSAKSVRTQSGPSTKWSVCKVGPSAKQYDRSTRCLSHLPSKSGCGLKTVRPSLHLA